MDDVLDSITPDAPVDTERVQAALTSRPATMADLKGKRRRRDKVVVPIVDAEGDVVELTLVYQAISSTAYDKLIGQHAPTPAQQRNGAIYNIDTFAPALIAAVCVEPAMSLEDATEIYHSDDWSGGEVGGLFTAALRICNGGLDVPFTGGV